MLVYQRVTGGTILKGNILRMGGPGKRRWDCQDLRLRVHPKQSGDGTPTPIRSHDPCRLPGDFMISHGGKP